MIRNHPRKGHAGQALVEMLLVLPPILLLMAIILPLVAYSVLMPWLDERLWLSQFIEEEIVHSELTHSHEKNLIPAYFKKDTITTHTDTEALGFFLPLLNQFFPGPITIKNLYANYPEIKVTPFENPHFPHEKISRKLAMISTHLMSENEVPSRVRNLTLSGVFHGKTGTLENFGLQLFHLNLDALPETDREGT